MLKYIFNKIWHSFIILFFLITISFFLVHSAPGGPFGNERHLNPATEAALMAKYHYDLPLYQQYWFYLKNLANGDLGISTHHKAETVNEIIWRTLPMSICLGTLALILALVTGVYIGVLAALHHNTTIDYLSMIVALLGLSVPVFVLGPLLQLLFSMYLEWFPVAGFKGWGQPIYIVLPAFTLSFPFAARIARMMRAGMLEVMNKDFVRTARAKGLRERVVIYRHALWGGILPVVSFMGPAVAAIVTGSLVIETVFQMPGLGKEFVQSALSRDVYLVLGTVVVYGTFIVVCNLLSDIVYGTLDPRVRFD